MVEILYGTDNPFIGISTVPFVGQAHSRLHYGGRYQGNVLTFTLQGQLTGACGDSGNYQDLTDSRQELLNSFQESFKPLVIKEDSQVLFSGNNSQIRSINFGESTYKFGVPYTITLDTIPDILFSGAFKVADPVNNFQFQENPDQSVTITHTVGARGIEDVDGAGASRALLNARDFVQARSGWDQQVNPVFITSTTGFVDSQEETDFPKGKPVILVGVEESINRLSASYQVRETYRYDPKNLPRHLSEFTEFTPSGLLRFTTDTSSGDGVTELAVQGTLRGGKTASMENLRDSYTAFVQNYVRNLILNKDEFQGISGSNINPVSKSIVEDGGQNLIAFSLTYNDLRGSNTETLERITIDQNFPSDITCMSYSANIRHPHGSREHRWGQVEAAYNNFDLDTRLTTNWATFGDGKSIDTFPLSKSISKDRLNAQVGITAEVCSLKQSENIDCFDKFEYTMDFGPALTQYRDFPILDGSGCRVIQNLNYATRAQFSIRGQGRLSEGCALEGAVPILKQELNTIMASNFTGKRRVLTSQQITTGSFKERVVSFSASWTAESLAAVSASCTPSDEWSSSAVAVAIPDEDISSSCAGI